MTGRLLSLVLLCWSSAAWALDRPHILWLTAEDLSPRLGCYGDATVPTPNLDRLADEGVRFTRAFTATGVCAPCRHTIITGLYPMQSGAQYMRTVSKSSALDEIKDPVQRREAMARPVYEATPPAGVRCFTEYLRAAGYYCTNNNKQDYQFQAPVTAWDESSRQAHYKNRAPGQPFFAVFNQTVTHESGVHGKLFIHETRGAIGPCPSANEKRCSDKGFRPTPLPNYLQLLDWTVRQTLADKRGSTQEGQAHVFGGKSKDVAKSARRKMSQTLT